MIAKGRIKSGWRIALAGVVMLAGGLILSSCRSAAPLPEPKPVIEKHMSERAMEFRSKVGAFCREVGVYLEKNSVLFYSDFPEVLAERCSLLGVTDVYLRLDLDQLENENYLEDLHRVVAALNRTRIRVTLAIFDPDLYSVEQNDLIDTLRGKKESLEISAKLKPVIDFIKDASGDEKIAGITLIIAPDVLTAKNPVTPDNLLFCWSKKAFGRGRDNDMLMELSFEIMKMTAKAIAPLPLSTVIKPSFHEYAVRGKVSKGRISDFIMAGAYTIIRAPASSPRKARRMVVGELKKCKKREAISICVITEDRLFGDAVKKQSYSWKKWSRFISNMNYIAKNCARYKSFRGLVFDDFAGLERVWEKED